MHSPKSVPFCHTFAHRFLAINLILSRHTDCMKPIQLRACTHPVFGGGRTCDGRGGVTELTFGE